MSQREPNPGESGPEITFLDYLRASRLGRAFAKRFASSDDRGAAARGRGANGHDEEIEGGALGFPARFRKAVGGGLMPLRRRSGKDAADPDSVQPMPAGSGAEPPQEPPHDPGPPVNLESVGAVLKRTREGYEEDLAAVAQTLHIRLAYLQAIEDQRFDRLPGPAYAVGFIRAYSDYLGLDSADMVRRFKIEVEGLDKRQELFFPVPVSESKLPGGAVIMVSLLCIGIAYGAWFYLSSDERPTAEAVPPVPEELGGPPAEETATASLAAEGAAEEQSEAAAAETPAEDRESEPATEQAELAGTAEPAPEEEPAEAAAASSDSAEETDAADAAADTAAADAAETGLEQGSATGDAITALIAQSDGQAAAPQAGAAEAEAESADPAAAAAETSPVNLARILRRPSDLVPPQAPEPPQQEAAESAAIPERAGAGRGASRQPLPGSPGIAVPADEAGNIPQAPAPEQVAARDEGRTPQVFGAESEKTRIVLRATQDSWVQIRDGNDDLLLTRVLRRGDEYRVPAEAGLTLLTGNAGGIEIVVDGAALSPLGPVGAVRRNIKLDPERLLDGTAIPSR